MIRPVSNTRPMPLFNDYQVLKGQCEKTMKPFGQPVSATHEARLMIEDDRSKLQAGENALYVIHQRSENRIVQIVDSMKSKLRQMPSRKPALAFPLPKAA
jgi:hypothetical protein